MDSDLGIAGRARESFGAYDVLGYFVPGFCLLAAITAVEWLSASIVCEPACTPATPMYSMMRAILAFHTESSWLTDALVVASLLLFAYVVGHIVASISAVAIDRILVARGYGYPLQYHLGFELSGGDSANSRNFYQGLLFWSNLYVVLRYLALPSVLPIRELLPAYVGAVLPTFASKANFGLGARVIGIVLIALMISRAATKFDSVGRPGWFRLLTARESGEKAIRFAQILLRAFAFPSQLVTAFISGAAGGRQQIDTKTRKRFIQRLTAITGDPECASGSSAYWLAYFELRRKDPAVAPMIDNWLRLYGFARNLATALYLSTIYCIFWWLGQVDSMLSAPRGELSGAQLLPLVYFAASFVMLQRYYYLYSQYYTKSIIRAFAYRE